MSPTPLSLYTLYLLFIHSVLALCGPPPPPLTVPSPLSPPPLGVTIPPRCSTELDSCPILLLLLPRRKKAYMAPTYAHRRPTPSSSSSYIPPSFLVSLALSSSPSLDRCRGHPKWRATKGIFPAPRYSCFAQSSKSQSLSQCKVNFWVSAFFQPLHST